MILSRNEISALCVKAARGAGLPLGHADDLGRAGPLLAERGELQALVAALSVPPAPVDISEARIAEARVAMAGPTAVDLVQAGQGPLILQGLDAPEVMHALADVVRSGVTLRETAEGLEVRLGNEMDVTDDAPQGGAIDVPDDVIGVLGGLAARTYVPASEASRIAGAGAGLTDND